MHKILYINTYNLRHWLFVQLHGFLGLIPLASITVLVGWTFAGCVAAVGIVRTFVELLWLLATWTTFAALDVFVCNCKSKYNKYI